MHERTLPNPLTKADLARIRDARPAGPVPQPAAEPAQVQRRVGYRGQLVIAGQRIHVGIGYAGATLTFEDTDSTFRITHVDQVVAEVARTTTKSIARFKARRPTRKRDAPPLRDRGRRIRRGTRWHRW